MVDEADTAVLHRLDLILRTGNRTQEILVRISDDMHEVKVRLTAVADGLAGVNRRLDRIEPRLDRIERRLDLADAR